MNPRTRRISSPADLLALVPCVLGFHPEDSLVLVVVAGAGEQLHARVDLSPDDVDLELASAHLLNAVQRTRARQVALIAYTDDPLLADVAVDRLDDHLFDAGVDVVCALRADGRRWYSLDCDDDCCPPEGRPYDLSSHPITAQSVLDGQVTYRSRAELADSLVNSDPDDVDAVAEAADEAMSRFRSATVGAPVGPGHDHSEPARRYLVAEGEWVRDRVRRFLGNEEPLDAAEAGRIAVALVNIQVRDVAWSEMNHANARSHVRLWRDLVRRTPLDLRAAPAALLGFAAWLSGDGALAWCAVERCQEAEPDYSLAGLLSQALVAAVPPSTWQPIPPEDLPLFAG